MWSWNEGWREKVLVIKPSFLCSIQGLKALWMNDGCRCDLQGVVGIPRIHLSFSQLSIHPQLAHSHLSVHALLREKKNHNLKYAPKNKQKWSPPQLKKPSLKTTLLSQALNIVLSRNGLMVIKVFHAQYTNWHVNFFYLQNKEGIQTKWLWG